MILIADAGSTKTDWRGILPNNTIIQAKTIGFNPFFQDSVSIATELEKSLLPQLSANVSKVYFYGTGCSTSEKCEIIQLALQKKFPKATIFVLNDILAAARALCGHSSGIACILGTGSNAALYNGYDIIDKPVNLGFWLGDEGSGAYLGKTLVASFLHHEMPQELYEKFKKRYQPINRDIVLENAYQKPFPNRYFASFSKFLFDNRRHPFCYQLVYDAFDIFFEKYVCKLPDYEQEIVHFTGSVAFYYSDILRQVASDKHIAVRNIMENPIAGLTLYHSKDMS